MVGIVFLGTAVSVLLTGIDDKNIPHQKMLHLEGQTKERQKAQICLVLLTSTVLVDTKIGWGLLT